MTERRAQPPRRGSKQAQPRAGAKAGTGKKRVQRAKQRHPAQASRPGAKRPPSPKVRRRRIALVTVMLALALIGFLFAFVYPTRTFLRQRHQITAAEQRLTELDQQTRKLERANAKLDSPAEIERIAREQYGMARPGETPYVLVPIASSTTTTPSSTTPGRP